MGDFLFEFPSFEVRRSMFLKTSNPKTSNNEHSTSNTQIKTKSPRPVLRLNEDKLGDGSSPISLSRADIRRILAELPASRRHSPRQAEFSRPHSRAVQRLAVAEFRVRPLSSLGLMVAPPVCQPGQDTFAILSPRLNQFALGRPPLLAVRWPSATGLAS